MTAHSTQLAREQCARLPLQLPHFSKAFEISISIFNVKKKIPKQNELPRQQMITGLQPTSTTIDVLCGLHTSKFLTRDLSVPHIGVHDTIYRGNITFVSW